MFGFEFNGKEEVDWNNANRCERGKRALSSVTITTAFTTLCWLKCILKIKVDNASLWYKVGGKAE